MESASTKAVRRRAEARRSNAGLWPVRRYRLGDEPPGDPLVSVSERVAQVWPLTLAAWAVSGLKIPDYRRAETPIVVKRLSELE